MVRTIQLLRKYVMNDNPVHIQVLSDQANNFSLCVRTRVRVRPPCAAALSRERAAATRA